MGTFYIEYRYIGENQPVRDDASRANTLARWAQIPNYINNVCSITEKRSKLAML